MSEFISDPPHFLSTDVTQNVSQIKCTVVMENVCMPNERFGLKQGMIINNGELARSSPQPLGISLCFDYISYWTVVWNDKSRDDNPMPLDMHNLSYVKIYLSDLKELSWVNPHRKHMVPFLELAGCLLSPVRIIFRSALISFNSTSSRPSSELPRHSNSTLIWPTMGPECDRLMGYNVCLPPVLLLWSAPGVYLLLAEKRQGSWSAQRAISILGIYRVHIKVCSSSQGCQSGAWDTHCSVHDWIKLPSLNVQQLGKDSDQYPSK